MIKILVVEDEKVVAWDIRRDLQRIGYEVVDTVDTAEAALKAVEDFKPDLIFMDIRLAGAEDGIAAAQSIGVYFDIPIIYLTAYADDITLRRATASNPYGYLIKPFRAEQLHTAIQVGLQRHRQEREDRNQQQQITHTLRSFGDATITTNLQGQVTLLNPAAEVLTGWLEEETLGKPIEQILQLVDAETLAELPNPVTCAIQMDRQTYPADNCCLVDRWGENHFIDVSSAPIKNDQGDIIGGLIVVQDSTERWQRQEQLRQEAVCDRLTGLPTGAIFLDRLTQSLKGFSRSQQPFAVILVDLDNFQLINDTVGRSVADRVLWEVGQRLTSCLRLGDSVARLRSDDFAILLQGMSDPQDAELCGQRLLSQFSTAFLGTGQAVKVQASIGIAIATPTNHQSCDLMRAANLALSESRQAGGNNYRVASLSE